MVQQKSHLTFSLTGLFVAVAAVVLLLHGSNPIIRTIRKMPLREKILQMMMVDFRYWDDELPPDTPQTGFTEMNPQVQQILAERPFGAVIYFAQNLTDTEQAFRLTMDLQNAATAGSNIPLLICADQEGGSVYRLSSGTALPGNMALAATGSIDYARKSGSIIGKELYALGINTALAPVVDVNNNPANPVIGLRSFSDDPTIVGNMASAVIEGMAREHVIGCAKHFPGHGDTATDSHYGLPIVGKTKEELVNCELMPYEIAISKGIDMIMTAHILYPQLEKDTALSEKTGQQEALPATMSDDIIAGLLKKEMGFKGIVVTDAMNMAGITDYWTPEQAAVQAINAGADMLCMPCSLYTPDQVARLDQIVDAIAAAVEDGTIPESRLDDAVTRILTVKQKHSLLKWDADDYSLEHALSVVGCAEHRAAEREMAAAAVTLVKNEKNAPPLRITSESRVLMMVPYQNETAQMILGWNRAKDAGLIPEGAQVQVVRFNSESDLYTWKEEIDWADTIIFNSEVSSARRMNGQSWESRYIQSVIAYAKKSGKTTVVQSVDIPYDVQSYQDADAVLAVYGCKGSTLDPTEALVGGLTGSATAIGPNIVAGIEVILGVAAPKGTLPVDIPLYAGSGYTEQILYPRGYGLSYQ